MSKKFIGMTDCVFVGGVFDGRWVGLDEVKVEEIVEKQTDPTNKYLKEKFCTFYYKGDKHSSQITQRPIWVFS